MKKERLLFNGFLDAIQMIISIVIPTALTLKSYVVLKRPSEDVRLTIFLSGICIIIFYIVKFPTVGKFQKVESSLSILLFILSMTMSILSWSSDVLNTFDLVSISSFVIGCIPIFLEMLLALFVIDMKKESEDVSINKKTGDVSIEARPEDV